MRRRGLALILVVGVLAVLAVLGSAFAVLSRLERKAASQRVESTRAGLLARSGVEDAAARLAGGQDPAYGGEDLDGNGVLTAGVETTAQVYRPGLLDVADCPAAQALRPSFFVDDETGPAAPPALTPVDGRPRGSSGGFSPKASWSLKVEAMNDRIHINGGSGNDTSMDGPNGFLVRLLNNLDEVVTGTSDLGTQVVSARPSGGYRRVEDLKSVLTAARYNLFRPFLGVQAWVDPTVLKPQPMDARPRRWEDIDDTHKSGADVATTLCGVLPVSPSVSGDGTEVNPWSVTLMKENSYTEGARSYTVSWERNFVFAWRQLRIAPPAFEPRAPIVINTATTEVLAAALRGLKGSYLEVWDGSGGYDDGNSWFVEAGSPPATLPAFTYPYPHKSTEETPWHRTRLDYGMSYGIPGRPYYGPGGWTPTMSDATGYGGKSLVQCAPLGRLKETAELSLDQARAVAREMRRRILQKGPFRTWSELNAFVDLLPLWENVDGDAYLDGDAYPTAASDTGTNTSYFYNRHIYKREDASSDGAMNNRVFTLASGGWAAGDPVWEDRGPAGLQPGDVKGLTFVQKDVIKAMANPNTDLNDFNPDANLWKEVDKTDVVGIGNEFVNGAWQAEGSVWVHTTEFALETPGRWRISSAGRLLGRDGRLLGTRQAGGLLAFEVVRDTAQADFMRDFAPPATPATAIFQGPAASYPVSGSQPLVSYPEPQTAGGQPAANAAYDGQVGLGFVQWPDPMVDPFTGLDVYMPAPFFDTMCYASGQAPVPDVRGPFQLPLVRPAGQDVGSVFPDGIYGEKDSAFKYAGKGGAMPAFWVKPNWFPEACPRPHALYSQAYAKSMPQPSPPPPAYPSTGTMNAFQGMRGRTPIEDIFLSPVGLFYIPNRNAWLQDNHADQAYRRGFGYSFPARSLIVAIVHTPYLSETVNRKGYPVAAAAKPVGRLEAHRWVHFANAFVPSSFGFSLPHPQLGRAATDGIEDPTLGGGGHTLFPIRGAPTHTLDGTTNHLRFGEMAATHNMNYVADATIAGVKGGYFGGDEWYSRVVAQYGRYFKEDGAFFVSPALRKARPLRATWTEVPCDLWFDTTVAPDGWMDLKDEDRNGNGMRDVRVDLELWGSSGRIARFSDPCKTNLAVPSGTRYRAVFVNEWDEDTRANHPLDVTPFLDDVTFLCGGAGGPRFLLWWWEDAP